MCTFNELFKEKSMKLLIRLGLVVSTLLLFSAPMNAQMNEKKENRKAEFNGSRWVFGGNVSAVFGNTTFVGANPSIGYRLTPKLTAGAGGMYYYWKPGGFSGTSIYGPTSFMRLNIGQSLFTEGDRLFAQTDYYVLNTRVYNPIADQFNRDWIQQFFVGGGYYLRIGQNVFAGVTVQVDLIQDPNSFFQSPFIGGGISVGL